MQSKNLHSFVYIEYELIKIELQLIFNHLVINKRLHNILYNKFKLKTKFKLVFKMFIKKLNYFNNN